jgi:molecular chaperone DnaK
VRDAELHADEDRKRREEVEVKNQLDTLVYQVEKMLNENREKLQGGDVQSLENAITEARKAMEQGDVDGMRTATENIQKASHKLAELMYQQTPPPGGATAGAGSTGAGAGSGSAADDVIEAEVVDEAK